jgi:signal transduction histidine kinase
MKSHKTTTQLILAWIGLTVVSFVYAFHFSNLQFFPRFELVLPILASAVLIFSAKFVLTFGHAVVFIILHNINTYKTASAAASYTHDIIFLTLGLSVIAVIASYIQDKLHSKILQSEKTIFEFTQQAALTNVAGSVAHEINSPLMVANTAIQLLSETAAKLPEEHRHSIAKLVPPLSRSIQRAALYTKSLIFFAEKPDFTKLEDFHLTPLLNRVENELKLMWPDIELRAECSPASLQIHADSGALKQALLNLMSNSARNTHGNGSYVTAIARKAKEKNSLVIEIADSCPRDLRSAQHAYEKPFAEENGIEKGSYLEFKLLPNILAQQNMRLEFVHDNSDIRFRIWAQES